MYSYDDRLRAAQLYIKLGKRAGLTIRQPQGTTRRLIRSLRIDIGFKSNQQLTCRKCRTWGARKKSSVAIGEECPELSETGLH